MTDTSTTESTATDQLATTDESTLESVYEQLDALTSRIEELEAEVKHKDERIKQLEAHRENDPIEINSEGHYGPHGYLGRRDSPGIDSAKHDRGR